MRWATPADYAELGAVMYDAVRNGPSAYSQAQRRAWVPIPRDRADWRARLAGQDILVSESGVRIAGFISLTPRGYIDFAFVRPAMQGTGLFALHAENSMAMHKHMIWEEVPCFRLTCQFTVQFYRR